MELEFLNWLIPSAVTLVSIFVGWHLNQKSIIKADERRDKKEKIVGWSSMLQHLASFNIISCRFSAYGSLDLKSKNDLKNDLKKWCDNLEKLMSIYAHLEFMPRFFKDYAYIVAQIDLVIQEEKLKKFEIENILNGIGEDIDKILKKYRKGFN